MGLKYKNSLIKKDKLQFKKSKLKYLHLKFSQ
ncbi:hypothetical protein N481_26525 [Pseudoalteromonas luteoviolacea S4047-1]|uniref:Uncharacterized protein n=1 Tax=Pseudoalteromonas luteoviolacea S4054 TaxID=1129367 RepID=A0A0F6A595_9GAMM|nr:hypothetical protein N479_23215 [Pseudoalteromonas luteoviolacea S4054]KZN75416.1 hypothetical protein N481_26525 [Pseudoalteromonas luteoviolacea S4047-1]